MRIGRLPGQPLGTQAGSGTWRAWWLEAITVVAVIAIVAACASGAWTAPLLLAPLLAVPPALAGIGASTVRRPLGYGAVSLLAAVVVALAAGGDTHWLPVATIVAVVVVTTPRSCDRARSVPPCHAPRMSRS